MVKVELLVVDPSTKIVPSAAWGPHAGPKRGFEGGPWHARRQRCHDEVDGAIPGCKLATHLRARSECGELCEELVSLGRDDSIAWPEL